MADVARVRQRLAQSTLTASGDVQPWFGKLMLEMAERAGTTVSEARARIYAHDLSDLTQEQIVKAARYIHRRILKTTNNLWFKLRQ